MQQELLTVLTSISAAITIASMAMSSLLERSSSLAVFISLMGNLYLCIVKNANAPLSRMSVMSRMSELVHNKKNEAGEKVGGM